MIIDWYAFVNDTGCRAIRDIAAGKAPPVGKQKRPPRRAGTCAVRSGCKMRGTHGIVAGYGKLLVSICRFRFVTRVRLFHQLALKRFVFAI